MSTEKTVIPEGYMENAAGHLIPVSQVSELDLLRNDLIGDVFTQVKALRKAMREFKVMVLSEVAAFIQLSADEYHVNLGGKKGNVSLVTFDGQQKIAFSVAETLGFDEKIHAAKAIIDECLQRWTEGSDDKIKALVGLAFKKDSAGEIRTQSVLALFKLDFKDPRWLEAMAALRDSLTVSGSKSYMRFYERVGEQGRWQQLSLDMAGL